MLAQAQPKKISEQIDLKTELSKTDAKMISLKIKKLGVKTFRLKVEPMRAYQPIFYSKDSTSWDRIFFTIQFLIRLSLESKTKLLPPRSRKYVA